MDSNQSDDLTFSAFVSWSRQPFKKAGILSNTPILSRSSNTKNPQSAIMLSSFSQCASFSKSLQRTTLHKK